MPNVSTQQLWDVDYLKGCQQEGLERRKTAQFEQDWSLAVAEAVRRVSNAAEHHAVCRTAACRRARRCVGNTIPCTLLSERELKPGEMQRLINSLYVESSRSAAPPFAKAGPLVWPTRLRTTSRGQVEWAHNDPVSRTRCGILHAAPQSRDPGK